MFYSPDMGQLPTFDLPDHLDLPNIAEVILPDHLDLPNIAEVIRVVLRYLHEISYGIFDIQGYVHKKFNEKI